MLFRSNLVALKRLSDVAAKALAKHKGKLGLWDVIDISDRALKVLMPKYAAGTISLPWGDVGKRMNKVWEARDKGLWLFRRRKRGVKKSKDV